MNRPSGAIFIISNTQMEKLKIGDKVRVRNAFSDLTVTIERVTKTMAISNKFNGKAVMRFKLEHYNGDVRSAHRIEWDTTTRTLVK